MSDRNFGSNTDVEPANPSRDLHGRFGPGNPGKPRGARHRATQAVLTLLEGEAVALTRRAVELALQGDVTALRLCLERLAPVQRERLIAFDLPAVHRAEDVVVAIREISLGVAQGDLTPAEGESLAGLVDRWRKAFETENLERRIVALEAGSAAGGRT